jgi:peptide/nickel transport system substrate-binding protein
MVVAISAEPGDATPLTGAWNSGFIGGQIFDPLLKLAANGSIQPNLATSWSVDTQAGTYTFHLRQGVVWSDGQPFTSADVKFTFENILNKYDVFGSTYFVNSTVTTPDALTAVIKPTLFYPGEQLTLFASGNGEIYPQHVLQGQDFLKSAFRTTSPVGTGPYVLTKWVAGQYIQLDANTHYWGSAPKTGTILVKFISDPAAITAGLQRGEINMMNPEGIPYEAVKSLAGSSSLNVVYSTAPPYVGAFWLNLGDPILSKLQVRQALAYAFNRTEMIKGGTAGISIPGQNPIDPNYVAQSPTMVVYNYDVAKANSLLDQAGYPKAANGTRFSLSILVPNSQPELVSDSQIAKTELAQVGINVNIQETDFGTYLTLLGQEKFQLFAVTYWTSQIWLYNLYDSKFIGKGPFQNNFQWNNPQADQFVEGYLKSSTLQQQQSNLQQFEDLFSQQLPAIILYRENWVYVTTSNVQGPNIPNGRYIFVEPSLADELLVSAPVGGVAGLSTQTILIAVAVVVVVLIALGFLMRRRRKPPAVS